MKANASAAAAGHGKQAGRGSSQLADWQLCSHGEGYGHASRLEYPSGGRIRVVVGTRSRGSARLLCR